MPDIARERSFEIRHRGKDTTGDHVAFDLGEPQFNLVEPGGVRRGEVRLHLRMLGEKRLDPRGLVRREVIRNHVNLFAGGPMGHEVGWKCDELGRDVAGYWGRPRPSWC